MPDWIDDKIQEIREIAEDALLESEEFLDAITALAEEVVQDTDAYTDMVAEEEGRIYHRVLKSILTPGE